MLSFELLEDKDPIVVISVFAEYVLQIKMYLPTYFSSCSSQNLKLSFPAQDQDRNQGMQGFYQPQVEKYSYKKMKVFHPIYDFLSLKAGDTVT